MPPRIRSRSREVLVSRTGGTSGARYGLTITAAFGFMGAMEFTCADAIVSAHEPIAAHLRNTITAPPAADSPEEPRVVKRVPPEPPPAKCDSLRAWCPAPGPS